MPALVRIEDTLMLKNCIILLAVDLQDGTDPNAHALAVRDLAMLMTPPAATLHVLSVYNYPQDKWRGFPGASAAEFTAGSVRQTDNEMKHKMTNFVSPMEAKGLQTVAHLMVGEAGNVILQQVEAIGADLLIIGTHSQRNMFDIVLGGTAQHVSRQASCMVVLVHPKRHA
jgi:nucleotide-binding universal stress UspA family protein